MSERKLPMRRKRTTKGRVIRVSDVVYSALNDQRRAQSWDCFLRILLGLPDRGGNPQPLVDGMLEATTGAFFLRHVDKSWEKLEEEVYEAAFIAAAKLKLKRVCKPLKMRELP